MISMKGTTAIKAELANYKENELIFASRLYKEKLSDAVEEAAYYKALERMCSAGELARAAKGIYYLPKKNKYGSVPPSDREIVDAFTRNGKGTVIGYSLYNSLGLTTQIPKTVEVLSSVLEEFSKTIGNVVVHKSDLIFSDAVENIVHGLDVLQNFSSIQNLNYNHFIEFAKDLSIKYDDDTFDQVISYQKYKKSTMSFLKNVLSYYNVSNNVDSHLSSLSKYKHPTREKIIIAARLDKPAYFA